MFYSDVVLQHAFRHCNNQNYNKRGGSALKMYNLSKKKIYLERERGRDREVRRIFVLLAAVGKVHK